MSTATSLREEVTALLQALLRADTVNPPGNETRAALVLQDYLASNGIESRLVARGPERANLIARLPGGDGPSLGFLCHTDTVVADPSEWQRDPWSGDLVDGEVWGRGALDMKSQVAAGAVALASLAREGRTLDGDRLFIATADEEVGDGFGLEWLVQAHPDLVRIDYAINEGGGERVRLADSVYYFCGTAEKMSAAFRLRVRGRSGHASMPAIADNALVKAAGMIETLGALRVPPAIVPEVRKFFEVVVGEVPVAEDALECARARLGAGAVEIVEPLLGATFAPTMIEASQARNVIPARCDVTVDCRLLPEQAPEDIVPLLRAALGSGDWEIEWIERVGGTRSSFETPLWKAIEAYVAELEPEARLLPSCNAGFTDSHYLREAFGTVAYGFFPMRAMEPELVARLEHSADERVPVDDLELGVDALRQAALALL